MNVLCFILIYFNLYLSLANPSPLSFEEGLDGIIKLDFKVYSHSSKNYLPHTGNLVKRSDGEIQSLGLSNNDTYFGIEMLMGSENTTRLFAIDVSCPYSYVLEYNDSSTLEHDGGFASFSYDNYDGYSGADHMDTWALTMEDCFDDFYIGDMKCKNCSFRMATDTEMPNGVLGLGGGGTPPFIKSLYDQKRTPSMSYSLFIDADNNNSSLLFGAIDRTKMASNMARFEYESTMSARLNNFTYDGNGYLNESSDVFLSTYAKMIFMPKNIVSAVVSDFGAEQIAAEEEMNIYEMDCPSDSDLADTFFEFQFDDITIDVPLRYIVKNSSWTQGKCQLLFAEQDNKYILGIPFFQATYFAIDFTNSQFAMGQMATSASGDPVYETITNRIPTDYIALAGVTKTAYEDQSSSSAISTASTANTASTTETTSFNGALSNYNLTPYTSTLLAFFSILSFALLSI